MQSFSKSRARYLDWLLIGGVALLIRIAFWYVEGTRVVGDATGFLRRCTDFSLAQQLTTEYLVYSGFSFPYCAFLQLPGASVDAWIGLQVLLSAISCVVLYEIGQTLINRPAGLVAGLSLGLTWQGFHYITRPQTQVFFTVVFVFTLWTLVQYRTAPSRSTRLLALGSMGYMAISRPNGVAYVAGFVLIDLVFRDPKYRLDLFFSRTVNAIGFGIVGILGFIKLYTAKSVFLPFYFWSREIIVTGHISYPFALQDTPNGLAFLFLNIHHIIAMGILKIIWFLIPILPDWSLGHILLNLVTLAPLTVGALLTIPHVVREETEIAKICIPPLVMVLCIVMVLWVPGPRKFLGPIIAVYGLLTGYLLTEHPLTEPIRRQLSVRLDRT